MPSHQSCEGGAGGPSLIFKRRTIAAFLAPAHAMRKRKMDLKKQKENELALCRDRREVINSEVLKSLIPGLSIDTAPIDYQLKGFFTFFLMLLIPSIVTLMYTVPNHWYADCLLYKGEPQKNVLVFKKPPNEINENPEGISDSKIHKIADRQGSCLGTSDMFCSTLSEKSNSYDDSVQYTLACYCTERVDLVDLWDPGLVPRDPIQEYFKLNESNEEDAAIDEYQQVNTEMLQLESKQNPILCAIVLIIIIIASIGCSVVSVLAVKWKPELRMSGTFHLVLNIVCLLLTVFSMAVIITSLRVIKGFGSQCKSLTFVVYLAVIATVLITACWFISLMMTGLATDLRRARYLEKRSTLIAKRFRARDRMAYFSRPSQQQRYPNFQPSFRASDADLSSGNDSYTRATKHSSPIRPLCGLNQRLSASPSHPPSRSVSPSVSPPPKGSQTPSSPFSPPYIPRHSLATSGGTNIMVDGASIAEDNRGSLTVYNYESSV